MTPPMRNHRLQIATEQPKKGDATPQKDFYTSQTELASKLTKSFEDAITKDRSRAELWGKGALAVGSAVLTGLGIGKLSDFMPDGDACAYWIVAVCFAVAILGVVTVGVRLSRVGRAVVMRTRSREIEDVDSDDKKAVDVIYKRFCRLNGVGSVTEFVAPATVIVAAFTALMMEGIEKGQIDNLRKTNNLALLRIKARIIRDLINGTSISVSENEEEFDRGANSLRVSLIRKYVAYTIDHPDLAEKRASLIRAEAQYVMSNAAKAVVRRRSVLAISGWQSFMALVAVPAGILAAFLVAGYSNTSEEDQDVLRADQKACADMAGTLKETGYKLPSDCRLAEVSGGSGGGDVTPDPAQKAFASMINAATVEYQDCVAKTKPEVFSRCQQIVTDLNRFIAEMTPPAPSTGAP